MLVDIQRSHTFTHGRLPPLVAFRNLVANKIPELFPGLRWGFIETGASWIPFVLHQLKGVVRTASDFWGPKLFEAYNMWISYEVAEDLPYLVQYIGEDHIVTGTDYGHHGRAGVPGDPSAQLNLVTELRSQEAYPSRLVDKLLSDNPKVLYGL
jgi:Tat protein secretion system quality control protein TatD with DNase activity